MRRCNHLTLRCKRREYNSILTVFVESQTFAYFICLFTHNFQGECAQEQLTNVFRSAIDLQAHVTSRHVNELGKAQQKQMRQIQPNFTTSRLLLRFLVEISTLVFPDLNKIWGYFISP